jgi:queuine tRNA-ribosyltransferase
MSYELRRQPNGTYALYNAELRETMHPHVGPWEEATRLYVGGSGLEGLLGGQAPRPKRQRVALPGGSAAERRDVVVFDVGLGGAANALAALACRETVARSGRAKDLLLISFDRDVEALAFAIGHADQLGYVRGHEEALRSVLESGRWEAPGVLWELRRGDFPHSIGDEPRRADVVFYDPFSHRTDPAMWSVPVLEAVYRCRRPGSGQRLVTYSSAYSVRAAFLLAGYYVGNGVSLDGRPTTIAATDFADLDEPLGDRWLARWRKDREPWPALTAPERHKALREALLAHPQWGQVEAREADGRGSARGKPDGARGSATPGRRGPARGGPRQGPGGSRGAARGGPPWRER